MSTPISRSWGLRSEPAEREAEPGSTSPHSGPAISKHALSKVSAQVRRWRLHVHTLAELARRINPIVRGWMQYYGAFNRTALYPLLRRINAYLVRWLRRKY
jgi:RNA-directed DNA polymerase